MQQASSATTVGVVRVMRAHALASRFDSTALFAPQFVREEPQ
jgi:hypothetical protein